MDLGSGRESGDQHQQQQSQQQQSQQSQPSQPSQPAQAQAVPAPISLLMPAQLQASSFQVTPVVAQQQQQQQGAHGAHGHHGHHEMAPSAAKLKLLNTPSGNGGSVLASKGSDQHIDQAREILRQAVVAVTEAGATKPSTVKKGTVRYRECQKNHAASIGGHAIDGCGEFMPGGDEGSVDALHCAACNCHRNFHRREVEGEVLCECKRNPKSKLAGSVHGVLTPGTQNTITSTPITTLALPSSGHGQMTPLTMAALSAGGPTDSDEQDDGPGHSGGMMMSMRSPSAIKKRFRTKFTTEQKDQMCAFAEKVGWRIQKHDEAAVQEFCATVGVKRHVLKVWMHNNKHTMGKKP